MVDCRFNEEERILYIKASGEIRYNYFTEGLEFLRNDKSLPKRFSILEDASEVSINLPETKLKAIAACLNEISENFENIRHALVIKDPLTTAFAFILKELINSDRYSFRVFFNHRCRKKVDRQL